MAKKKVTTGRFSLQGVKEALIFKALASGKLYQPLRTFFQNMRLEWNTNAKTAYATLVEGNAVIALGPAFFNDEVKTESEAAEVLLHEIMHHLFRHLDAMPVLLKQGYSQRVQNLAMDAVINAYLHSVGCAGFMERFYADEGEYAFLRPNSKDFLVLEGKWMWAKMKSVHHLIFDERQQVFPSFYHRLYRLDVSLEEALEFFKKYFEETQTKTEQPLLGGHEQGGAGQQPIDLGGESQSSSGSEEGIFRGQDAKKILADLGLQSASRQAKDNFAKVIAQITTTANEPGPVRTGRSLSRRIPAKLNRGDMLRVERGQDLFQRADYRLREAWLFFDDSGSMAAYRKFCIDLAKSLGRSGIKVHPVVWANRVQEIPLDQFLRGEFPNVGVGTDGEMVAKYFKDQNIGQAVIVTDNYAGDIATKVSTQVHLCLIAGGTKSGSFVNPAAIPHCKVYQLEV